MVNTTHDHTVVNNNIININFAIETVVKRKRKPCYPSSIKINITIVTTTVVIAPLHQRYNRSSKHIATHSNSCYRFLTTTSVPHERLTQSNVNIARVGIGFSPHINTH